MMCYWSKCPQKYEWGVFTISWTLCVFQGCKIYIVTVSLWLGVLHQISVNYLLYYSFYDNNHTAWFLWVLSPRLCVLVRWDFSVLKVILSLLPYMSSHNSLLWLSLPSCKIKLLILTYLIEVSWRPTNIYRVLRKPTELWAAFCFGLYSKAKNPPPIVARATLKTWPGTEIELSTDTSSQIMAKIVLLFTA